MVSSNKPSVILCAIIRHILNLQFSFIDENIKFVISWSRFAVYSSNITNGELNISAKANVKAKFTRASSPPDSILKSDSILLYTISTFKLGLIFFFTCLKADNVIEIGSSKNRSR